MKFIPVGLQCSVPEALKRLNLREYSYPFDWLWSPSKTTYECLNILINEGTDKAIEYMTTGFKYYQWQGNEHFVSINEITKYQINKETGGGNTNFPINNEYKSKLRKRFDRMMNDIRSLEQIIFIYADAANPYYNYYIDEIEYGLEASDYLIKIYDLIYPINNNIRIMYFCWNQRKNPKPNIEYIFYEYQNDWFCVTDIIEYYLKLQPDIVEFINKKLIN